MAETTTCAIVGGGPAGMVLAFCWPGQVCRSRCWRSTAISCATFAVTRCTRRRCSYSTSWVCGSASQLCTTAPCTRRNSSRTAARVTYVDFGRLHLPHPFVAMVPQWDLLNLLADAAQAEASFTLRMKTEVTGLLREGSRITGVRYQGPDGSGELRAELTVACDGRGVGRSSRGRSEIARLPGELRRVVVPVAA